MTHRHRQRFATVAAAMLLAAGCAHAHSAGAVQGQKPLPKLLPLQVDYNTFPRTWREALDRADLVVVIEVKSFIYEKDNARPLTRFSADVIEVIKEFEGVSIGGAIAVVRAGGVQEVRGVLGIVEEADFEPWAVGQTLLVFLKWFDQYTAYTLPFGPASAFELNPTTKKVRAFTRATFASRQNGRDVAAVLAEVKAGR